MTADDFYRRVEARLPETIEVDGRTMTHELLTALAERFGVHLPAAPQRGWG